MNAEQLGVAEKATLYNSLSKPPITKNVFVSITLSKAVDITIEDYDIDENDNIDISQCDLEKLVKEQIYLPNEASTYLRFKPNNEVILKDLDNWFVDDFVVINEEYEKNN